FPVNAHGLIRTVGNDDAYLTPIYHVFKQYREQMTGNKLDVTVAGPSVATDAVNPTIDGDSGEADFALATLPFIDAAAVRHEDGNIYVSLVNRSPDEAQQVRINIPAGYRSETIWVLEHENINARNDELNRTEIAPLTRNVKAKGGKLTTEVRACGLQIVKLVRAK